MNRLFCGDNLAILRKDIPDDGVELVFLDPPFKSHKDDTVRFKEQDGSRAASEGQAFEETWTWGEQSREAFDEAVHAGGRLREVMKAFRMFPGGSDMMAYMAMMAPRPFDCTGGIWRSP